MKFIVLLLHSDFGKRSEIITKEKSSLTECKIFGSAYAPSEPLRGRKLLKHLRVEDIEDKLRNEDKGFQEMSIVLVIGS